MVYNSVGKATFAASLHCLKRFGMLVSFGQSSGAVPPLELLTLTQKELLYVTRSSLMHHVDEPAKYAAHAAELFDLLAKNVLTVHHGGCYKLADAAQAHWDLEVRQTSGALLLVP